MYPLWLIIGFWFLLAALYVFLAGVTYKVSMTLLERACSKCSSGRICYADHQIAPFFTAIVWPLGMPLVAGVKLASWLADVILNKEETE
jgi:hypothetical protein